MNIKIVMESNMGVADSTNLDDLRLALEDAGIHPTTHKLEVPSIKDGGLTIGLTIASLTISAISSFISALAYWQAAKNQYTVTIEGGGISRTVKGTDQREVLRLAEDFRKLEPEKTIIISVSQT